MQVARPLVHDGTVERLWRAARASHLPHALLFEGRAGIGKYLAAKWFAMGCLCERGPGEPCASCAACKRVLSGGAHGNHADLFVIDPEDPYLAGDFERSQEIRIGRIAHRDDGARLEHPEYCVERFLDLRSTEGGFRPVLIREAQRMNAEAQNALLKTLEEPRAGTVMVLETHKGSLLRPPVRSRCVRIRFDPLSHEQCERVLLERGLDPGAARALGRMAEGSPGLALAMARSSARELRERLVAVVRGERDALAAAEEIWQVEGEFAGGTDTARQRERVRVVLNLALALLRDVLRSRAGVALDALAHGDVVQDLPLSGDERELRRRCEDLLVARDDVEHNLAPGAILDRALLALGEGRTPARA